MHGSVQAWVPVNLTEDEVRDGVVLEVGAYDVNGSVRPFIERYEPASYTGTDMQPGPRVDRVVDAADLAGTFGVDYADVVISTEMLEHAEDWQAAVRGMLEVLRPGGVLLLTARGPGFPYHDHPGDYWRFTVETMSAILELAGLDVLTVQSDPDPASPGVFAKARKPAGWWAPAADAWDDIEVATITAP